MLFRSNVPAKANVACTWGPVAGQSVTLTLDDEIDISRGDVISSADAPAEVAEHADWPVNECDLHARHKWLVNQAEFRESPSKFTANRMGQLSALEAQFGMTPSARVRVKPVAAEKAVSRALLGPRDGMPTVELLSGDRVPVLDVHCLPACMADGEPLKLLKDEEA